METLELIKNLSWAGVAGLFIWCILKPLIEFILAKMNGNGNNKQIQMLDKKVNNELTHDIMRIDDNINEIWREIRNIKEELAEIKTCLKIKQIL